MAVQKSNSRNSESTRESHTDFRFFMEKADNFVKYIQENLIDKDYIREALYNGTIQQTASHDLDQYAKWLLGSHVMIPNKDSLYNFILALQQNPSLSAARAAEIKDTVLGFHKWLNQNRIFPEVEQNELPSNGRLSRDQTIEILHRAFQDYTSGDRFLPMFLLSGLYNLKASEIARLETGSCIYTADGRCSLKLPGKKTKYIEICPTAAKILQNYLSSTYPEQPPVSKPFFPSVRGIFIYPRDITSLFAARLEKYGIEGVEPRFLRGSVLEAYGDQAADELERLHEQFISD